MRRFGRLMAAAGAAAVVVGVSAGSAAASPVASGAPTMTATARAAHARAPVHGCPAAAVCLYSSKAVYRNDKPTVVDTDKTGVFVGGTFDAVAVNNTTATYSSEGYIEARIIHSFTLCEYVPDLMDVQSPGAIENPADGAFVTGIATGATAMSVSSIRILPAGDCGTG
jgi:hypothetical protein